MSGIRNAALVTVGLLAAFVGLAYPDLFLLGLAIVLAVWLIIVHAQRDEIAAKWGEAVFAQRSAEHRAETLAGDRDALVARLAEVLDEHAECPAPVRVAGPICPTCEGWNPVSGVRTRETAGLVCQTCGWDYAKGEKPRPGLRVIPQQRTGSES